jgi:tetratricopeptide (TPR) repeat protein
MKGSHVAAFFIALLIGGLFALSLFSMQGLQKLEAGPLVRKAIEDPQRGEEQARRAGEVLNGDGATGFALARWLVAQGHPKLAVALLQPVTTATEGRRDPLAWGGLAWAAKKNNDPALERRATDEARRAARTVLAEAGKAKPGDPRALRLFQNTGTYFSEKGLGNDGKQAIAALRVAYRLAPRDAPSQAQALNALGYTLADSGTSQREFDEAVTLTEQALKKDPDNPMILDSYGWALFKQGKNLPAARRTLRAAVDLALDQAELRYHLAAVCAKLNLYDEALLEAKRALKLDPGHEGAQALQAALLAAPKAGS